MALPYNAYDYSKWLLLILGILDLLSTHQLGTEGKFRNLVLYIHTFFHFLYL